MEFRNLVTFLRVAETGSFTAAAKQLQYVQSTVTIQIKQLENELGTILFDRIGRKVELTSDGETFRRYAIQIVNLSEQAKQINKEPGRIEGNLRIGILESLLIEVLSGKLLVYHENFPLVRVHTRTSPANVLFELLKQNELDILYFIGKKMHSPNFIHAWSKPVNIEFVTYPDHPLAQKKEVLLSELSEEPLILTEDNGFYRDALDEAAMEQGISLQPLFVIDNTTAIKKLLKQGVGISFLPEYTIQSSLAKQELATINVIDCPIHFWSQLLYHKNKFLTPQMEYFIDLIKEN